MSQLTYTDEELAAINERVWSDPPGSGQESTNVPCPACGADTRVLISWSGSDCGALVLIVNCPGCGRSGRVKPSKNRCPSLDEAQMGAVVEGYQRGQRVFCPTCGTPLNVLTAHTLGELSYTAYCHRGGGMGHLAFPR